MRFVLGLCVQRCRSHGPGYVRETGFCVPTLRLGEEGEARQACTYAFHHTGLADEAFSSTLRLGVTGEEERNAIKLVTTLGCKKAVVGETSMNGLGHKSVSECLPSTVLEKVVVDYKSGAELTSLFTKIYHFNDTVLGHMWRELSSSTIDTGIASPVQRQGESGGSVGQ